MKLNDFIDNYQNDNINTFSWYIDPETEFSYSLAMRLEGGSRPIRVELLDPTDVTAFKLWLVSEIQLGNVMSNNCYHYPESEFKMHFYVKKHMMFNGGKKLVSDYHRNDLSTFRDVPAEDTDYDVLDRFLRS